jgi:tripartite-type tricarboxylate transporter receptor subunit TctC
MASKKFFRRRQISMAIYLGWLFWACHPFSDTNLLAQSAPFYKDKTIRIVVGFTAGGLYDQYARLLARYMGKHLPGNPNIIVQNMPGAGSIIATNYVAGVAKPDGLALGMVGSGIYLDQLLGVKEARFDVRTMPFIGSVDQRDLMLYMRADAPWKSVEDIMNAKEPPKCGATGTSDLTTIVLNIMEETLGAKLTNVRGYPGGVEIDLALEKGELHCRGTGITTHFAREPYHTWHKTGFDRHILQTGNKKDPRIAEAPTLPDLMEKRQTPAMGRSVAKLLLLSATVGRPLVTTPGVPPDRVQLLREAYVKAFKEPELLAEAKKARMEIGLLAGEDVEKDMRDAINQPKDVVARVKKLME